MDRAYIITEWFELYGDDVYQFLVYYSKSTEAEDLVQEVFIKAYNGYHNYRHESHPKTWLFSIARRTVIDYFRKSKRRQNLQSILTRSGDILFYHETPEVILQLSEEKQELLKTIHSLKSSYRDVLILRGIQELSIEDTASILNWSDSKVSLTFHRALKALTEKMKGGNES